MSFVGSAIAIGSNASVVSTGSIQVSQYGNWLVGYYYRKAITVQNTNIDVDLNDFPLYVKIDADTEIGNETRADGYDVRFTNADGRTLLNYERESWSGGNGSPATASFWVKTDLSTSGTTIYVYYGKADATDSSDPANVWDSDYESVWHLSEATGVTNADSVGNNDGTPTDGPVQIAGKIDGSLSFDGSDDYVSVNNHSSLNNMASTTISLWIYLDTLSIPCIPISKDGDSGYYIQIGPNARVYLRYGTANGYVGYNNDITTGAWYQLVMTFEGTTARGYKNGVQLWGYQNGAAPTGQDDKLWIGANSHNGVLSPTAYFVDGKIDEVRISSINRSDAWIKFEYNNIAQTDNELTWGVQVQGALCAVVGLSGSTVATGRIGTSIVSSSVGTNGGTVSSGKVRVAGSSVITGVNGSVTADTNNIISAISSSVGTTGVTVGTATSTIRIQSSSVGSNGSTGSVGKVYVSGSSVSIHSNSTTSGVGRVAIVGSEAGSGVSGSVTSHTDLIVSCSSTSSSPVSGVTVGTAVSTIRINSNSTGSNAVTSSTGKTYIVGSSVSSKNLSRTNILGKVYIVGSSICNGTMGITVGECVIQELVYRNYTLYVNDVVSRTL